MINFILSKLSFKYVTLGLVILLVLMSLLYQLEKTRHRLTTQEYKAFKANLEIITKENKQKIKTLGTIYDRQIKTHEAEHKAAVDKLNLDRTKLKKGLQNEVNRYNSIVAFSRMRQNNAGSRGLPKDESTSKLSTSIGEDSNSTLVNACRLTTLDYNALYDAWMLQCNVYGCE